MFCSLLFIYLYLVRRDLILGGKLALYGRWKDWEEREDENN